MHNSVGVVNAMAIGCAEVAAVPSQPVDWGMFQIIIMDRRFHKGNLYVKIIQAIVVMEFKVVVRVERLLACSYLVSLAA